MEWNEILKKVSVQIQLAKYFTSQMFYQEEHYQCSSGKIMQNLDPNISQNILRIDYLDSDPDRFGYNIPVPFYLFSLYLALVEYISCQMNMTIKFVYNYDGFYNDETFIMDLIPFDENANITGEILIYDVLHEMLILTALKTVKSQTYFTFLFLFDWIFWIVLFVSVPIIAYSWKLASQSKYSFGRSMMDVIRTVTTQSSHSGHFWTWLRKQKINISLDILMYTWFFVMGLLTKWMSGLLLDSYLPDKSLPLVEGINDLYDNYDIEILQAKLLQEVLDHEDNNDSIALARKIMKRYGIKPDEEITRLDEFSKSINSHMIDKIVQGKSVLLCDSSKAEELEVRYSDQPLVVAKDKFAKNFNLFWVNNRVSIKIQRCIEAGLDLHLARVNKFKIMLDAMKEKKEKKKFNKQDNFELKDVEEIHKDITNNEDEDGQDHNSQQEEFVITVDSIMRGVLLIHLIGVAFSIMAFFGELVNYYFQNHYLKKDGFDLRNLKSYKLREIQFKRKTYDTIIITYQKNKETLKINPVKLHRVLKNNYDLYSRTTNL